MREEQYKLYRACLNWLRMNSVKCSHAVTLTLKPYRVRTTARGRFNQPITDIEAARTFRQFLNRLNYSIYGNSTKPKRGGKSVCVIPVLEGKATQKLLHYHCCIGGFPANMTEEEIQTKIANAWRKAEFGNTEVEIKQLNSVGWQLYIGKELKFADADGIDWQNVRLPASLN